MMASWSALPEPEPPLSTAGGARPGFLSTLRACVPASTERVRVRAPARALVLFAPRRRAQDRRPRQARRGRPAAGAGADRHQQPLRRARVLREAGRVGHPADRRHAARVPFEDRTRAPGRRRPRRRTWCSWRRARRATATSCGSPAAPISTSARRPPRVDGAACRARDGLIALTGGPTGPLDTALRDGATSRWRGSRSAQGAFGDRLYVEIQRHGLEEERAVEAELIVKLADRHGLPLVATNEPFFAKPDDYEAHDALLCHRRGPDRLGREPAAPLARARLQDARRDGGAVRRPPGRARRRRVEIAMRCAFRVRTRKPILPRFRRGAGGGRRSTRARNCAGRPRPASRGAWPRTAPRRAWRSRTTATASPTSSG